MPGGGRRACRRNHDCDPSCPRWRPPTNHRELPVCRDFPAHWGNAGAHRHRQKTLHLLSFLHGAELMGKPTGRDENAAALDLARADLDAAQTDLAKVRRERDAQQAELTTTRDALETTVDALAEHRARDAARHRVGTRIRELTDELLADPRTGDADTEAIPRQRVAS